jgi:hypothetical protein
MKGKGGRRRPKGRNDVESIRVWIPDIFLLIRQLTDWNDNVGLLDTGFRAPSAIAFGGVRPA